VSVPRITEALVAASRITRCVRVTSFIAASLARRGAWRIGRRGPIFWRARSHEIVVAMAVACSRLSSPQRGAVVRERAGQRRRPARRRTTEATPLGREARWPPQTTHPANNETANNETANNETAN
jgi:hypothetical protein